MKRFFKCFMILAVLLAFTAAPVPASAASELSVFAAASMAESLNKIAADYKKICPDLKIVYNFDSSGTLKTQIENGAECDIFISAGQKQMNELDIKADPKTNPKKRDMVMDGTRFNIVSNKVVMVVPKGHNPKGISDFKDVVTDKVFLLALGNSDVPVGQYSVEVFKFLGIWDGLKKMNKVTFASNVKEVLAQVEAGAVDCGVVYSTDAASSGKVDIVAEAPKGSHKPVVYPAAIMKRSKNEAAAMAFVEYLKSTEGTKVFVKTGFTIPK